MELVRRYRMRLRLVSQLSYSYPGGVNVGSMVIKEAKNVAA